MGGPPWRGALHTSAQGTILDVELVPNADRDEFPSGYNAWRKRIQARVRAPARDGLANAALLALVAQTLQLAPNEVELVGGASDRQKRILVRAPTSRTFSLLEELLSGR